MESTPEASANPLKGNEGTAHTRLGEFASTAICGNDITSSCLYVSALAIGAAGKYAFITLGMVAAMLYLFRRIYAEVVGALPLNGGAYNALLNTTSKGRASVAACLTILSYMATAVISAGEAMHYLAYVWDAILVSFPLPVIPGTLLLIAGFTVLTIMGISESSRVAIAIFVTHMATLTLLAVFAMGSLFVWGDEGTSTFRENWRSELLVVDDAAREAIVADAANTEGADAQVAAPGRSVWSTLLYGKRRAGNGEEPDPPRKTTSVLKAIFFGFAVALLGISGFESSSNFVEEQKPGVFPKTLRNMWIAVTIFNPLMALLALGLIPIAETQMHFQEDLLAEMGKRAAGGATLGNLFAGLISIDAFLVLSGAVLTSFVGVNGLVRRMTLDRCLPQFLLETNSRGTTHRILIMFFLMCASVLLMTLGDIGALAGVYTISFLTVMALFAIGNILLKVKRANLPRPTVASWTSVFLAITGVTVGLIGNAVRNPRYLEVFLWYFLPTMLVVGGMLYRMPILRLCLYGVRSFSAALILPLRRAAKAVENKILEINAQQIVFFTRGDNVANLNSAMQYVLENEDTHRIKVVTIVDHDDEVPAKLADDLSFLDEAYPEIHIEFVQRKGKFGPQIIQELSEEWKVPTNLMFIGSPRGKLPYGLAELGGVRLII